MHEVLLIYRSKYGSAKAYAEMAAERLGGLACTEQQATEQTLGQARCLALFGSLYAGGLSIAPFMKKHAALLGQKRAAVFAVGATGRCRNWKGFDRGNCASLPGDDHLHLVF